MTAQTYDPVVGSESLAKWRLMNPLRPPDPGRCLVLVRDSGPSLTVHSGEEISSPRYGTYRSVFTVDVTEHRLILDIALLSRDPNFTFRSQVDLMCRVADPVKVVARGIRDMSGTLYGPLRTMLREVAREYDISEFHETEQALNAAVSRYIGDDAVRLRNIRVELLVDVDEIATSGREFRDIERETRLSGMRRRRHLDMINEEGVDGLIAEIVEKEGARAALTWIEKAESEKRAVRHEVMRMVLARGDNDREPFEQAELERAVLDEVLRDGGGAFETATRRSRLGGSLARALDSGPREEAPAGDPPNEPRRRGPLEGEVVADTHPTATERRDGGRGSSARPGSPPEDEPLPSASGGRVERRPEPTASAADAPQVSRVRGTAKRPRGGPSGSTGHDGERR